MDTLLINLIPLIVAALLVPLQVVATLFLLQSENGLNKAVAFAAGAAAVRIAQGIVFGLVFSGADDAGGSGGRRAIITSTLLLVLGILLLITAYKTWRKEEDPDAPPPKWMASLRDLSVAKAFGFGVLLMLIAAKQWVFTLSAIGAIREAQLGQPGSTIAYLFFMIGAQALVWTLIIITAAAPNRAGQVLDTLQGWLEQNSRVITIGLSLVFGAWFVVKGVTGLLA